MQNKPVVIVLDKNENSRKVLMSFLQDFDLIENIEVYEDYDRGFENIKKQNGEAIVIVDITDIDSDEFIEKVRLHASKLIITSTDYSTNTIVKALRMGAKEFLPKPIIKNDLLRTISSLINNDYSEVYSQSKIITVYSNKGGIGKTTLAINLAKELEKVTKCKVALIDLNLQLGDVSTFLNLNPTFDVSYVIKNFINKDEEIFLKAFERYKDSLLYILSDPTYIEQAESISPQDITKLFNELKKVFFFLLVDMSSNIDENSLKILDLSDLVLFTTIVNVPAIRNAQRCLTLFNSRRYPKDKVKIIVNRYIESDDIKIEDIENTLGEKIYWRIPNNYFTIMEAINKGICVSEINSNSNIANNFRDLAAKISDDIIEKTVMQYRV